MKKGLRVIAMVTLVSFLTTQCVSGAPAAGIQITGGRELPTFLSIDVPAELGTVDALYEAPGSANPQFILHIQNAHANYEAQIKIKQLLGYMNKKYGFKTIFVEGASAKLDADYLRLFPDAKSNNELCDALAKQGELTGAELFLMEQSGDPKSQDTSHKTAAVEALGIEQAKLYRSNYEALKKVFGAETDINRFFSGFDSKLDRVASTTFTPEARQLIADWKRFEQGRREFMPFIRALAAKSKKILKIDLESLFAQVGWPQISRLLVIQQLEKDLNKEKGLAEKAALIKMLRTKKVSKELLAALEAFNEGSVSVGKSATEVSPRQALERLASEAGPKGFKFSDYPAFSLFAGYVTLRSELDPKVLFEEIEYLFTQMLDTLAQDPQQKTLLALYRDGELLRKLLRLELNRAQWRQILAEKDRVAISSLVQRLKSAVQTTDHGLSTVVPQVMPPAFEVKMTEVFNAGLSFYDFAHQREAVFYKEMQDAMSQRKITKAILITGGFHTDGMSDMFRDNAVSYGIVTPRLAEKSNENLYRNIMMHKNVGAFDVSYLDATAKMIDAKDQLLQQGIYDASAIFSDFAIKINETDPARVVAAYKKTLAYKKLLASGLDVFAENDKITLKQIEPSAKGFRPWAASVEAEPNVDRVARHLEAVINDSDKLKMRFEPTVRTEGAVIMLREAKEPYGFFSYDLGLTPQESLNREIRLLAETLETDAAAIQEVLSARSEARTGQELAAELAKQSLVQNYLKALFDLQPARVGALDPALVATERRVALIILAQAMNVTGLSAYLNDPKNAVATQTDSLKDDFVATLLRSQASAFDSLDSNVKESLASGIAEMLRKLIAGFEAFGKAGTVQSRIAAFRAEGQPGVDALTSRSEVRSQKELASMMLTILRPTLEGYVKQFEGVSVLSRDQQEMIWAETDRFSDSASWVPLMREDAYDAAALYSTLFNEFVERDVKSRNAFDFLKEAVAKLEAMARSESRDLRTSVQTFLDENVSINGAIRGIASLKSASDWRKYYVPSLTSYQAQVVAEWVAASEKAISKELAAAGKDPAPTLTIFVPLLNKRIERLPNVSASEKPSVFPGFLQRLLGRSEARILNAKVDGNDLSKPYAMADSRAVLDAVRALFEQNKLSTLSITLNITGTPEEIIYTEQTGTRALKEALAKKTSEAPYSLQVLRSEISPRVQITLQRSESRQFEFKANGQIYMVGIGDKTIGAHTYNLPDGTPDVFLRLGDTQQFEGTLIAHYEVYRAENPDASLGTVTVHYVHDPAYDAELRGYAAISLFSDPARTAIRITAKDDAKLLNLLNTWRMQPVGLHGNVKGSVRSEARLLTDKQSKDLASVMGLTSAELDLALTNITFELQRAITGGMRVAAEGMSAELVTKLAKAIETPDLKKINAVVSEVMGADVEKPLLLSLPNFASAVHMMRGWGFTVSARSEAREEMTLGFNGAKVALGVNWRIGVTRSNLIKDGITVVISGNPARNPVGEQYLELNASNRSFNVDTGEGIVRVQLVGAGAGSATLGFTVPEDWSEKYADNGLVYLDKGYEGVQPSALGSSFSGALNPMLLNGLLGGLVAAGARNVYDPVNKNAVGPVETHFTAPTPKYLAQRQQAERAGIIAAIKAGKVGISALGIGDAEVDAAVLAKFPDLTVAQLVNDAQAGSVDFNKAKAAEAAIGYFAGRGIRLPGANFDEAGLKALEKAYRSSQTRTGVTLLGETVYLENVNERVPLRGALVNYKKGLAAKAALRSEARAKYFLEQVTGAEGEVELREIIAANEASIEKALRSGIQASVDQARKNGSQFSDDIVDVVVRKYMEWMTSAAVDRYTKRGNLMALESARWTSIIQSFYSKVGFGTAGPRGPMAHEAWELQELQEKGFRAEILKGPNTINNVTMAGFTMATGRHYMKAHAASGKKDRPTVPITWDTRIAGPAFVDMEAAIFLKLGINVALFDESSPTPLMSFAVAFLRYLFGWLSSASHNPAKYGGNKVANGMGAQVEPATRVAITGGLEAVSLADVAEFIQASVSYEDVNATNMNPLHNGGKFGPMVEMYAQQPGAGEVVLLTDREGKAPSGRKYVNIHTPYAQNVASLLMDEDLIREQLRGEKLFYSPMYGNGYNSLVRILKEVGLSEKNLLLAKEFNNPDGMFTLLTKLGLIPDPGNSAGHAKAWGVVFQNVIDAQYKGNTRDFLSDVKKLKALFGTDPDSDRLGFLMLIPVEEVPVDQKVKDAQLIAYVVPPELQAEMGFGAIKLISANDTWATYTKDRVDGFADMIAQGKLPKDQKFNIIKSHVTSNILTAVAEYGRKVRGLSIRIWEPFVGFSLGAEYIMHGWEYGEVNITTNEESGGTTIGGAAPAFWMVLRMLQENPDLLITADGKSVDTTIDEVTKRLTNAYYFKYKASDIAKVLQYLAKHGVVNVKAKGQYELSGKYRELAQAYLPFKGQENDAEANAHNAFWKGLRPLIAEQPGPRLGVKGHTLEKDGLMALIMMIYVTAKAKWQGKTINQYVNDELYLNPLIGYYANANQGFAFSENAQGSEAKMATLENALALAARVANGEKIVFAGYEVDHATIYIPSQPEDQKYANPSKFPVEKYKQLIPLLHAKSQKLLSFFPEEGIRFWLKDAQGNIVGNVTIRPSGTENKLRYYAELVKKGLEKSNYIAVIQKADMDAYNVAKDAQAQTVEAEKTPDARSEARVMTAESAMTILKRDMPGLVLKDSGVFGKLESSQGLAGVSQAYWLGLLPPDLLDDGSQPAEGAQDPRFSGYKDFFNSFDGRLSIEDVVNAATPEQLEVFLVAVAAKFAANVNIRYDEIKAAIKGETDYNVMRTKILAIPGVPRVVRAEMRGKVNAHKLISALTPLILQAAAQFTPAGTAPAIAERAHSLNAAASHLQRIIADWKSLRDSDPSEAGPAPMVDMDAEIAAPRGNPADSERIINGLVILRDSFRKPAPFVFRVRALVLALGLLLGSVITAAAQGLESWVESAPQTIGAVVAETPGVPSALNMNDGVTYQVGLRSVDVSGVLMDVYFRSVLYENSIVVVKAATGKVERIYPVEGLDVGLGGGMVSSPDGKYVALGSRNAVTVMSLTGPKFSNTIGIANVDKMTFVSGNQIRVTFQGSEKPVLVHVSKNGVLTDITNPPSALTSGAGTTTVGLGFADVSGKLMEIYFRSVAYQNTILIVDSLTKKVVRSYAVEGLGVGQGAGMAVSPDGKYLALGSRNAVAVMSLTGSKFSNTISIANVDKMTFADGNHLRVTHLGTDETSLVYIGINGSLSDVTNVPGFDDGNGKMALSQDGKYLAEALDMGRISLTSLAGTGEASILEIPWGVSSIGSPEVTSMFFDRDGLLHLTVKDSVTLFGKRTPAPRNLVVKINEDGSTTVVLSGWTVVPGNKIAYRKNGATVLVKDLATGKLLAVPTSQGKGFLGTGLKYVLTPEGLKELFSVQVDGMSYVYVYNSALGTHQDSLVRGFSAAAGKWKVSPDAKTLAVELEMGRISLIPLTGTAAALTLEIPWAPGSISSPKVTYLGFHNNNTLRLTTVPSITLVEGPVQRARKLSLNIQTGVWSVWSAASRGWETLPPMMLQAALMGLGSILAENLPGVMSVSQVSLLSVPTAPIVPEFLISAGNVWQLSRIAVNKDVSATPVQAEMDAVQARVLSIEPAGNNKWRLGLELRNATARDISVARINVMGRQSLTEGSWAPVALAYDEGLVIPAGVSETTSQVVTSPFPGAGFFTLAEARSEVRIPEMPRDISVRKDGMIAFDGNAPVSDIDLWAAAAVIRGEMFRQVEDLSQKDHVTVSVAKGDRNQPVISLIMSSAMAAMDAAGYKMDARVSAVEQKTYYSWRMDLVEVQAFAEWLSDFQRLLVAQLQEAKRAAAPEVEAGIGAPLAGLGLAAGIRAAMSGFVARIRAEIKRSQDLPTLEEYRAAHPEVADRLPVVKHVPASWYLSRVAIAPAAVTVIAYLAWLGGILAMNVVSLTLLKWTFISLVVTAGVGAVALVAKGLEMLERPTERALSDLASWYRRSRGNVRRFQPQDPRAEIPSLLEAVDLAQRMGNTQLKEELRVKLMDLLSSTGGSKAPQIPETHARSEARKVTTRDIQPLVESFMAGSDPKVREGLLRLLSKEYGLAPEDQAMLETARRLPEINAKYTSGEIEARVVVDVAESNMIEESEAYYAANQETLFAGIKLEKVMSFGKNRPGVKGGRAIGVERVGNTPAILAQIKYILENTDRLSEADIKAGKKRVWILAQDGGAGTRAGLFTKTSGLKGPVELAGHHQLAQSINQVKVLAESMRPGEIFFVAPPDNIMLAGKFVIPEGRGLCLYPAVGRVFADFDENGVPLAETVVGYSALNDLTGLGHVIVGPNNTVEKFLEKPSPVHAIFDMLFDHAIAKWHDVSLKGNPGLALNTKKSVFFDRFEDRFVDQSKISNEMQRYYMQELLLLPYMLGGETGKNTWMQLHDLVKKGVVWTFAKDLSRDEWLRIWESSQVAVKTGTLIREKGITELKEFLEEMLKYLRAEGAEGSGGFANLNTFYFSFDLRTAKALREGYDQPMQDAPGTFADQRRKADPNTTLDWSRVVLTPETIETEQEWVDTKYLYKNEKNPKDAKHLEAAQNRKNYSETDFRELWKIADSVSTAANGLSAVPFGSSFWFDTGNAKDVEDLVRMTVDPVRIWKRIFIRATHGLPLFGNEAGNVSYPRDRVVFDDPENTLLIDTVIEVPQGVTLRIGTGVVTDKVHLKITVPEGVRTVVIPDGTLLTAVNAEGYPRGATKGRVFYHYKSTDGLLFDDSPKFTGTVVLKNGRSISMQHWDDVDKANGHHLFEVSKSPEGDVGVKDLGMYAVKYAGVYPVGQSVAVNGELIGTADLPAVVGGYTTVVTPLNKIYYVYRYGQEYWVYSHAAADRSKAAEIKDVEDNGYVLKFRVMIGKQEKMIELPVRTSELEPGASVLSLAGGGVVYGTPGLTWGNNLFLDRDTDVTDFDGNFKMLGEMVTMRSEARKIMTKEEVNSKLDELRAVEREIARLKLQINPATNRLNLETKYAIGEMKKELAILRHELFGEKIPEAAPVAEESLDVLVEELPDLKKEIARLEKLREALEVRLQEVNIILADPKAALGDRARLTQEMARKSAQLANLKANLLPYHQGLVQKAESYVATLAAQTSPADRSEVLTGVVATKAPALEIEIGESVVVKRQAFALEVWKLLTPEIRERLLNLSPEYDVDSLAGILGYIIIPADAEMTPAAVAAALLSLAKERSGEVIWARFVELAEGVQSSAAAQELFSFSDRPGGVVSLMTRAPSPEMVRELLFQLGVKTGQVVALVVANDELANDLDAQKAIEADIEAQARKSFDHNGRLINTQDGTPLGERIRIVFSSANLVAAKDALNNAGVSVGKAVKGTQNVVVLINELKALVDLVSVGTVLDGTGDEALGGNPEYATLRHWISGQVSELVDASKSASVVAAELVKQLNEVVVQVRGKNLWLNEKALAGLQALQSKLDEMRALAVAA